MKSLLLVAFGGAAGSVLRYLVAMLISSDRYPVSTFVVNLAGCFLFGYFSGRFKSSDPALSLLLLTGFCGGLTTFSTFTAENMHLLQEQRYLPVFLYMFLSVGLGLAFSYAGLILSK